MRAADRGWLAGIFDGEGCLRIGKYMNKYGRACYYARVQVVNTDRRIVERCALLLGGVVRGPYKKGKNRKVAYEWVLASRQAAQALRKVLSELVAKRRNAELLLQLQDDMTWGNSGRAPTARRTTESQMARREDWYRAVRALNKRGT